MEEITYSKDISAIAAEDLRGFFVDWKTKPSPETHLTLLQQSDYVVIAKVDAYVIGFITAISDGVLSSYIPFLEVLPKYQNKGIGQQLVALMLEELQGFYMIDLQCDPELQSFYENFSMHKSCGMHIRNYKSQTGI